MVGLEAHSFRPTTNPGEDGEQGEPGSPCLKPPAHANAS